MLLAALTMLMIDRHYDGIFFADGGGGAPLLWQHLSWIFFTGTYMLILIFAFGAIAALTTARGGDDSDAAALPTACENFVDATELMAEHGSAAVVQMSGGDPLDPHAQARSAETLQGLLHACDAKLAMMAQ